MQITDFKYLVWCKDNWPKRECKMYVQNEEKTWWTLPDDPNVGFNVETVEKHSHIFFLFNTEVEAKEFVHVKQWEVRNGKEPVLGMEDFCCPSCSRRFEGKYVFEYEEVDTSPYEITCLCGEKILVEPWIEVGYTVKKVS